MPSPFPGMDPYLEDPAFWADFHDCFLTYWCDSLNERLPETYEARIQERISVIDETERFGRLVIPDVAVLTEGPGPSGRGGVATLLELEPVTLPLVLVDQPHTTYIQIHRTDDRRVVSVIELLSPANESGSGHEFYLERRNSLLHEDLNLFEMDLMLGGQRIPLGAPLPSGDYYAFVSRANRRPTCDVFSWSIRRPLPALPIPLRPPDPDVVIPFADLFRTAYDRGRYARSLAYHRPPPGPVSEADRAWVQERAAAVGR